MAGFGSLNRQLFCNSNTSRGITEFKPAQIEQSLAARFESQVVAHGQSVAVWTQQHRYTYEELNQWANRIAHAILARCGSGSEPVCLLLDNDAPMIAAILGSLKAGKIYVPLDPTLPQTRTAYMASDSRARLIVTGNRHLELARKLGQDCMAMANIDDLPAGVAGAGNPDLSTPPQAPAWVLYTSGSTGRPKGVVQTHRNVLHFIMSYTNTFGIDARDRLGLLYSCCVNAGAHIIFSALLNGAALYPWDVKSQGVTGLAAWLIQRQVTIYGSVPTLFQHMAETLTTTQRFPHLRLIKMKGEPVYKRHVDLFQRHFNRGCVFVNRLGSTETGSICWYFVDHDTEITGHHVPVGYPVVDNDVLVVDENGQELPRGRVGEIIVRSPYLSPGYWHQPELTAAVFDPAPDGGGTGVYRTGDVGRISPDGCLTCLGRKDFQIKIRGHRIEAVEVETALVSIAGVKEAIVVGRQDHRDDMRLVAYWVADQAPPPTVTTFRQRLAPLLPEYMIPAVFVEMETLPRLPNGKIDRRGLPAAGTHRPRLDAAFAPASTHTERQLATIWAQVLGLDGVGINDNFLELGGNSLLAARIVTRVIREFKVELSIPVLLRAGTVAAMALTISQSQLERTGAITLERVLAEVEQLSEQQVQAQLGNTTMSGETGTKRST